MTSSSVLALDGDQVVMDDPGTSFEKGLDGISIDELKNRVLAAKADPYAVERMDMKPTERYGRAQVAKPKDAAAATTTTEP